MTGLITDPRFWLIVWGIILVLGLVLACTLIGGGNGQHKGDPAPFRRRQPAPQPDTLERLAAEHHSTLYLPAPIPHDTTYWPMAPVTAPLHPSAVLTPAEVGRAADDSIWDRHGILREQLWERLNAEAEEESSG